MVWCIIVVPIREVDDIALSAQSGRQGDRYWGKCEVSGITERMWIGLPVDEVCRGQFVFQKRKPNRFDPDAIVTALGNNPFQTFL